MDGDGLAGATLVVVDVLDVVRLEDDDVLLLDVDEEVVLLEVVDVVVTPTTVSMACPWLPVLFWSPEYRAVTFIEPGTTPVTVTAQPCCCVGRVQVVVVIERPLLAVQVTVSVGSYPDTVAVHVADEPTAKLVGEQLTDVVLGVMTLTVRALEVTVTGVEALSVTCSSKCHVPAAGRAPVVVVGRALHPDTNEPPRLV